MELKDIFKYPGKRIVERFYNTGKSGLRSLLCPRCKELYDEKHKADLVGIVSFIFWIIAILFILILL